MLNISLWHTVNIQCIFAIIYWNYDIMRYICCYGDMCTALHLGSMDELESECFCPCCLCGGVRRCSSAFEVQLRASVGVCEVKRRRAFSMKEEAGGKA